MGPGRLLKDLGRKDANIRAYGGRRTEKSRSEKRMELSTLGKKGTLKKKRREESSRSGEEDKKRKERGFSQENRPLQKKKASENAPL